MTTNILNIIDYREARLGEILEVPKNKAPSKRAGLTNQEGFEFYRRVVESNLRSPPPNFLDGLAGAMQLIGIWGGRYSRRAQIIDWHESHLDDRTGLSAVMIRNKAIDEAFEGPPTWDDEFDEMFARCLANSQSLFREETATAAHSYGPSLRQLWNKGFNKAGVKGAFEFITEWARHRPSAWLAEDERKKRGKVHQSDALGELLHQPLNWECTEKPETPWRSFSKGKEYFIMLLEGDEIIGSFHDWPDDWNR